MGRNAPGFSFNAALFGVARFLENQQAFCLLISARFNTGVCGVCAWLPGWNNRDKRRERGNELIFLLSVHVTHTNTHTHTLPSPPVACCLFSPSLCESRVWTDTAGLKNQSYSLVGHYFQRGPAHGLCTERERKKVGGGGVVREGERERGKSKRRQRSERVCVGVLFCDGSTAQSRQCACLSEAHSFTDSPAFGRAQPVALSALIRVKAWEAWNHSEKDSKESQREKSSLSSVMVSSAVFHSNSWVCFCLDQMEVLCALKGFSTLYLWMFDYTRGEERERGRKKRERDSMI